MKTPFAKSLAFFLLALALAACNSGSNNSNPSTFPNCNAPGSFVAVYPINGATNVPDGTQSIYVASSVTARKPIHECDRRQRRDVPG